MEKDQMKMNREQIEERVYIAAKCYATKERAFTESTLLGKLGLKLVTEIAAQSEKLIEREKYRPYSLDTLKQLEDTAQTLQACPELADRASTLFLTVAEDYHELAHRGVRLHANSDLHYPALLNYLRAGSFQQAVAISLENLTSMDLSKGNISREAETIGKYGTLEEQKNTLVLLESRVIEVIKGADVRRYYGQAIQILIEAYCLAGGQLHDLNNIVIEAIKNPHFNLKNVMGFRNEIEHQSRQICTTDETLWLIARELSMQGNLNRIVELGETQEKWQERLDQRKTPYQIARDNYLKSRESHLSVEEIRNAVINRILGELPRYVPEEEAEQCLKEMISS